VLAVVCVGCCVCWLLCVLAVVCWLLCVGCCVLAVVCWLLCVGCCSDQFSFLFLPPFPSSFSFLLLLPPPMSAAGEWPNEELYLEYTFFLQFLKKDLTEAGRVYRAGLGRHSETNGAPLLNYGYALMLALRRDTQQNDADESERRLTNAFKNDPVRTAARRVELMLRCLIKLDGLNPDILATYAVFHTMLRNYPSARRYYMRAIKLDPYNDKIVGSFAELEEMEVRKRATIRGETPTAWFKDGEDFQFEELALDEVERSVVFSTLQEEEDGKRERKDQVEIKRDQDRENEQRTKEKNTITHTNLEHQKLKQSKIAMNGNYLNRQDAMVMAKKKKQIKDHKHSKGKTNNKNPVENPEEEIQEEKKEEEKNQEETTVVVQKKKTLVLKQDKKKRSSIRLLFTCKMLGQNVMIEGVQIWHPPSALLIELGLANPYRPDDFPDPAPVYRMFLSDLDVRMFVNVLDMSHLLHARHRTKLLKMMLDRIVRGWWLVVGGWLVVVFFPCGVF
jgi:tetratricopeptide (TPR) repeat protein